MTIWKPHIDVVTMFVADLAKIKEFYEAVFGLSPVYQDEEHYQAVFHFGTIAINLWQADKYRELGHPAPVASSDAGARVRFGIEVDDVEAACELLRTRGVTLINGPLDQWWGDRVASFADPAGFIWEVHQESPRDEG